MGSKSLKGYDEGKPSFEQAFAQYKQDLLSIARFIVKDEFRAEEIVMDVFLKYWNKQKNLPDNMQVKAYLVIATRNACISHLRKYNKTKKDEDINQLLLDISDKSQDSFLDKVVRSELINEAYKVIELLPEEIRKIVILCHLNGVSEKEMAQVLNRSHHTVRNQRIRGLELIKKLYKELYLSNKDKK